MKKATVKKLSTISTIILTSSLTFGSFLDVEHDLLDPPDLVEQVRGIVSRQLAEITRLSTC